MACLAIMMASCASPVRYINDSVKKNQYMLWECNKIYNTSTVARSQRNFFLEFVKPKDSDSIRINVYSNFLITEEDYQDTAYLIFNNLPKPVGFTINKNVNYLESKNFFSTTTSTTTDVKNTSTKTTTGNLAVADGDKKVETNVNTETKTSTNTNTAVKSEILNKVNSSRTIILHGLEKDLINKVKLLTLRIYDATGDYWNLKFKEDELSQMRKLFMNKYDSVN